MNFGQFTTLLLNYWINQVDYCNKPKYRSPIDQLTNWPVGNCLLLPHLLSLTRRFFFASLKRAVDSWQMSSAGQNGRNLLLSPKKGEIYFKKKEKKRKRGKDEKRKRGKEKRVPCQLSGTWNIVSWAPSLNLAQAKRSAWNEFQPMAALGFKEIYIYYLLYFIYYFKPTIWLKPCSIFI